MPLFTAFGQFAGQAAAAAPSGTVGMELIVPTSITNISGTATLGTNGLVTCTGVSTLRVEGVFSATYKNYLLQVHTLHTTVTDSLGLRMRNSGGTATGSNYVVQYNTWANTSSQQGRTTTTTAFLTNSQVSYTGAKSWIYGPFVAEHTLIQNVNIDDATAEGVRYQQNSIVHELNTSYTGYEIYTGAGGFTGVFLVYGMVD